ncbi:hypothetical protein F7725_021130 [Dissostichus mawsoni]|uniref:Uncharacterized protein n=1 Tax=Dissostichus mawsoni TaxID=36200 RepID=A0A7J5YF54_DISMA|nr:hypothetical protein F7725_021130 [Dissostichus mawsoni]
MLAAATSKTCATTLAYPHGESFIKDIRESDPHPATGGGHQNSAQREGYRALYRGLTTHLVRQIPNTAIVISTYELVVYLLNG